MKHVDLDEPTSCLDHVLLGCTQRECEANDSIIDQYKDVLNHESLLQQLKSFQGERNLTQKRSHGVAAWKDMLKRCV